MAGQPWLELAKLLHGYAEDTYEWFTRLGFQLLRPGGGIGFITADTFFTLASFATMRELLQSHRLTHLGQCDPFDATVDAAIFVARKSPPAPQAKDTLLFIQARPRPGTAPDKALESLPPHASVPFTSSTELPDDLSPAEHGTHTRLGQTKPDLRVHRVPLALYQATHKRAFFEPRPGTLHLWDKFNAPVKALVEEWWECIESSDKFLEKRSEILDYSHRLKPGDVTLLGLISEGGQGLATANNARFLGYLEGTEEATKILGNREDWTKRWLADPAIATTFLRLLTEAGGDAEKPLKYSAAWEACVEPLRANFTSTQLGFSKTDLYRIVPSNLVADEDDFRFAWQQRKDELLKRWQTNEDLDGFWDTTLDVGLPRKKLEKLHKAKDVTDADFIELCREMQRWAAGDEDGKRRAPREAVGLRSSEDYTDADDAPRIATIYNGLSGRGRFVPFRKGDPAGNLWLEAEPLFCEWTKPNVAFLFENSGRRAAQMPVMRNPNFFLLPGVSWTRGANHVPIKVKLIEPAVMDVNAMKLSPLPRTVSAEFLVALMNADLFSFFLKRFVAHTWMAQISDLRMMPVVMPTKAQAKRIETLAGLALRAKRHDLDGTHPDNELVAAVRPVEADLFAHGPAYLHPSAQQKLLSTATDCLAVIERAVSWEAERLYGVEALGPFDEF